jgi:DNA-binding transcriptional regulator YiaG
METSDELLNQEAFAALLNNEVSTSTLEKWRVTGQRPTLHSGRTGGALSQTRYRSLVECPDC